MADHVDEWRDFLNRGGGGTKKSQQWVLPWQATASNRKHREMKERERSKATVAPTAPTMPADGAQEQKLEEKALCFDSAEMCVFFF